MNSEEVAVLDRAHRLFPGGAGSAAVNSTAGHLPAERAAGSADGAGNREYRRAAARSRATLRHATRVDDAMRIILVRAIRDHAEAHRQTRLVLDEARADVPAAVDTPIGRREAMRRQAARLRAQHRHVAVARWRARRRAIALRLLRYRLRRAARAWVGPSRRAPNWRAALAVRAALSRLGRPYVWGATGPEAFDCSGLVQWAYERAGVHLDRTTYQQILQGIPVPRALVQPGDLVFPHPGHVQLAIGNNQVVEAPHAGAHVRISELGASVQIRRPVP